MSDLEEARRLLRIAERELRALRGMSDALVFCDELFGFVAQQASEKALKAWLCAPGEEYPLTHDLARLLAQLQRSGQEVEAYWDLLEYSPFAVEFRYDEAAAEESPLDRELAATRVKDLTERVNRALASAVAE